MTLFWSAISLMIASKVAFQTSGKRPSVILVLYCFIENNQNFSCVFQDVPLESEESAKEEQSEQSATNRSSSRRRRPLLAFLTSYKDDNNPEAVQHLAKTLGLIGDSSVSPLRTRIHNETRASSASPSLRRASTISWIFCVSHAWEVAWRNNKRFTVNQNEVIYSILDTKF